MKFTDIYDQKALEKSIVANCGRPYQQCSMSVMDTIADPDISFDENGVSNYYHEYKAAEERFILTGRESQRKIGESIDKIKSDESSKEYDCILGLSGGVDSTYLCLWAKRQGLNPLVVHCDNGWNSELAQHNIENTVKMLGFDLYTYVIDWREFKELQRSYIKASVVDIEALTDHAFMTVLYEQARKWNIKYVLAGMNIVTEQVLPSHWIFSKSDVENIKDIQRKHGEVSIKAFKSFPFLGYDKKRYYDKMLKLEVMTPLNWLTYNYDEVKETIQAELNWRDYGGKHYESIWTRFYQAYILPKKFNIDKRKAHLSNLIFSGQLSKGEALELLKQPTMPSNLLEQDYEYVLKKLGFSEIEFEKHMSAARREHMEFAVQQGFWSRYSNLSFLKPLADIFMKSRS